MDEAELLEWLKANGQSHLFDSWESDDEADEFGKTRLVQQLKKLDSNYPGGLKAYVGRAKDLLKKSKEGENPYTGYTPHVPETVRFAFGLTEEQTKAEKLGLEGFQKTACVLVAGGLGERLGYSGIKVELPSEISSGTTFLGLYCEYILALQDDAKNTKIPFAIMTSDDTHDKTLRLLERENYYGLERSQVHLLKQEKVASLMDDQARIALKAGDRFAILTKPHGHGDVHTLLHQSGLAKEWITRGIEWLIFFQDTNPMSFRTLPATLGVSMSNQFAVNSVAFPRKAKSASGALMRLKHEDGHEITINVEYNFVDSLLRSTVDWKDGDVNGPDGYSKFPGNMNQLIFFLPKYAKCLEQTGGGVPEFVNPKYADESRTKFKSPTRLECMMQDFPLAMKEDTDAKIGVTVFEDSSYERDVLGLPSLTHRLYCPAKNNLTDGVAKAGEGVPDATTTSTELAIYACNSLMLKEVGCTIGDPVKSALGGIEQPLWPRIVLLPRFLPLFTDLCRRFNTPQLVSISRNSTLVVNGDVTFEGPLKLDGALFIFASPGAKVHVKAVDVQNRGLQFAPIDAVDLSPEAIQIRGFGLAPHQIIPEVSNEFICIMRFSNNSQTEINYKST